MDATYKLMVEMKIRLAFEEPEIARLIFPLEFQEVNDDICMETDGKRLFYNREAIRNLTSDQITKNMRELKSAIEALKEPQ
ncbi:hypothetical protein ACF3NX_06475 [Acetobacter orientalis]|uniref:hypothetical protein n=1 Tax=Acetobacter orientalis TaxID=146474 RepID=UPI00386862F0